MKEIKSTKYVADDGKVFENKNDCIAYESCSNGDFMMLDVSFSVTNVIQDAAYVYLENDGKAEGFVRASNCEDVLSEGIDGKGVYFYDDLHEEYLKIADSLDQLYRIAISLRDIELQSESL